MARRDVNAQPNRIFGRLRQPLQLLGGVDTMPGLERLLAVLASVKLDPRHFQLRRRPHLHEIGQPTFILNGVHDVMIPTVNSFYMARNLPNAQLFIYPDAGHAAQFQVPQRFLRHAVQFLSE